MPEPLVLTRALSRSFRARSADGRTAAVRAVDDVSLAISPGESLALVGESGSGKTTLGRMLSLLLGATSGELRFRGTDVVGLPRRTLRGLRRDVQMVFQDPVSSLNPRHPVESILIEPLRNFAMGTRAERRERALAVLEAVGLARPDLLRFPHELSGGQRQRVALARALVLEPSFVVADEPVSALDVSVRGRILDLLGELKQRFGLTYLFIGHDLAVIRQIAERVGVMYLGRIVELAPQTRLFTSPRHPYTRSLLDSVPTFGPGKRRIGRVLTGDPASALDPPAGCHFHPRCRYATELCRSVRPTLQTSDGVHWVACHHQDSLG